MKNNIARKIFCHILLSADACFNQTCTVKIPKDTIKWPCCYQDLFCKKTKITSRKKVWRSICFCCKRPPRHVYRGILPAIFILSPATKYKVSTKKLIPSTKRCLQQLNINRGKLVRSDKTVINSVASRLNAGIFPPSAVVSLKRENPSRIVSQCLFTWQSSGRGGLSNLEFRWLILILVLR